MTSRLRQRLVSLAALAALIAIVVGVPILLIAVAGWPLPTSVPAWSGVTRAINQGDIPAATVVKVLAVISWVIWLQVTWALVWEVVVNLPRLSRGHRPRHAPLVAAPVGSSIGRLVALVLTVGISITSTPAAAVALPTPTPVTAPATTSSAAEPAEYVATPTVRRTNSTWTVEQHDSLWRIAEMTLGDGERSGEILELNTWLHSARDLKAGQVLALPESAQMPTDRPVPTEQPPAMPAPAAPTAVVDGIGYVPLSEVMIQTGDTLWDLTEARLELIDEEVTPAETVDHLNDVIAANPNVIENPNLIYPGEVFTFPGLGSPPPPIITPLAGAEPATPASSHPNDAPTPGGTVPVDSRMAPAPPTVPKTTVPATAQAVGAEYPAAATSAAEAQGHARSSAPWLAGISGATALATGLLLLYRRRLALRAARGARAHRAADPDDPTTLIALTRAADIGLVRWANQRLADLFAQLQPGDVDGQPFAVELSDTHGIEILWTSPNAEPPLPWTTDATGWSWRLAYDPDQACTVDEPPAALPALVTIGSRDGNQLLLNLEATGTLDVIGEHPNSADDFIRSLIVELAAGELLSDTYIINAGIQLDGLTQLERVHSCDVEVAVERARTAAAAAADFLTTHQLANAFEARLGGDAAGRESTVLTIRARADIAGIHPGLGVCCVSATTDSTSPHSIVIDTDGTATLHPSGLRFDPVALPLTTLERVSDLLDEASELFDPEPSVANRAAEPDPTDLGCTDEALTVGSIDVGVWKVPTPDVLVRVLGAPEVLSQDTLGPIETSIVAYVACHGNNRRDDQVINAVWNGRAIEPKTLWNKISRIRTALGTDIVPTRPPKTSEITFSDRITTDLAILQQTLRRSEQVSQAEALDLLLYGLDLVTGVPFDGSACDWAYETQDHAIACETVETATLMCVQTALELGDLQAARTAITQGLQALPMNEPLYRARMRVEAASGNPQGVREVFAELRSALDLRCDDGFAIEVAPETEQLVARLSRTATASEPTPATT